MFHGNNYDSNLYKFESIKISLYSLKKNMIKESMKKKKEYQFETDDIKILFEFKGNQRKKEWEKIIDEMNHLVMVVCYLHAGQEPL